MTGIEAVASVALTQIFSWTWKKFEDDIVESSTGSLKKMWTKFELSRAAERYTEDMKRQYGFMHIWRMARPIPLEKIFTHVHILDRPSAFRRRNIEQLEAIYLGQASYGDILEKSLNGVNVVRTHQRLFILGKPGAGKTTFLKHTALQALNGELDKIPIFVPLRRFAESEESLFEFIIRQFEICDFPDATPFITTILKQGKAIVLFDGLDEVNKEDGLRDEVVRELTDFSNKYNTSQIIITCRVAASEYFFEGFIYVEMADFTTEQIQNFVQQWFHCTDNPYLADDNAKHFLAEFNKPEKNRLRELAKSPLLLTLLCLSFEETLEFPDRRTEIYEEAFDALLRKWDSKRGIKRDEIYHSLSLGRKRQMFARIAAETFERGEYLFEKRYLAQKIAAYLKNLPSANEHGNLDGEAVIQAIAAQHGVFVERAQNLYSFSHLTFQEYFSAKYVIENAHKGSLKGLLSNHLFDENWHEVFLLTAEMLDDADNFFETFLEILDQLARQNSKLSTLLAMVEDEALDLDIEAKPFELRCILLMLCFHTTVSLRIVNQRVADRGFTLLLSIMNGKNFREVLSIVTECDSDEISFRVIDNLIARIYASSMAVAQLNIGDNIKDRQFIKSGAASASSIKVLYDGLMEEIHHHEGFHHMYEELLLVSNMVVPHQDLKRRDWRSLARTLYSMMESYRPISDYMLTDQEAEIFLQYLYGTKLLLNCLDIAYVSDRKQIEQSILCNVRRNC